MGIFGLRVEAGITVGSGVTISSQYPPTQGEIFAYTKNTYFNFGPNYQQSGITTTSSKPGFSGPSTIWQLCYAWQQTSITQMGINCYQTILNSGGPYYSRCIADQPNSLTTLTYEGTMGYNTFGSIANYSPGQFLTPSVNLGSPTIPAGTYFMVAVPGFLGTTTYIKPGNRTAYVSGQPFVTMTNMIFYSTLGASPSGVPNQVGGIASGYVFLEGTSLVASFAFG